MTQQDATTLVFDIHLAAGRRSRSQIRPGAAPKPAQDGRVPRVSKLMALAIRFQELLDAGEVADFAELARLGRVTPARITQVMDMNLLAPDVQEALLHLPPVTRGKDRVTERHVRAVARNLNWSLQRAAWSELVDRGGAVRT